MKGQLSIVEVDDAIDEPRHCDECGAMCDMRIAYCECDPSFCPYPPVQ